MIIDNICNITLLLLSCYLAFYQHLSAFSKFWQNYAEFCRISPRLTPWKFFNTPTQKSNFASLGLRGSHLDTCRRRWRPAATPRVRESGSPGEKISKKISKKFQKSKIKNCINQNQSVKIKMYIIIIFYIFSKLIFTHKKRVYLDVKYIRHLCKLFLRHQYT